MYFFFLAGVKKSENGVIQAGDRPDNYWYVIQPC